MENKEIKKCNKSKDKEQENEELKESYKLGIKYYQKVDKE